MVIVVDRRGRILLQERDEFAPKGPNRWAIPGGSIEDMESPAEAAERELFEETGLKIASLALFWHGRQRFDGPHDVVTEWYVYCGRTEARQEDVVVGEGRRMIFTSPFEIAGLPLVKNARHFLNLFLRAESYAMLAGEGGNG